jgi:hypothetical protein
MWTEDLVFLSLFENVTEVKQKEQPSNTKLLQEVAVTVTQANNEVMSENAGTRIFNLT